MAFEYRYRFSIDEEIISSYDFLERAKFIFEARTNFIVKDRDGEERIIDSERYADARIEYYEKQISGSMGRRFKDYFMPDEMIDRLNDEVLIFAKQIAAGGRQGKIPVAVDLDVLTVQQEGEGIEAAADRAMRPQSLPPPFLYSMDFSANPGYESPPEVGELYLLLGNLRVATMRLENEEDVGKVLGVMEVCPICGRKPVIGNRISLLRCGHVFHFHCIVRHFGGNDNHISCPICHCSARDLDPNGKRKFKILDSGCAAYVD